MKKLILALVIVAGFLASALTVHAVSDTKGGVSDLVGDPPEKKDFPTGEGQEETEKKDPPPGEQESGSDTKTMIALTGVLEVDGTTEVYDGGEAGATIESTTTNQNVVLAKNGASLTISRHTLNKRNGDTSSEDQSNFFAVNAVVAAVTNASVYIDNSKLYSNAKGANCLFATGEGSTNYAYHCTISSTNDSSRGLDATYEGTVIGSELKINTLGDHCAALATDRGNGYISVTKSTLSTAGQGSPLIYSTGVIEVNGVTGTAIGAQIAGIEGLSTIRIRNSDLFGSGETASESFPNGVMIYQSMSGDSEEGTATFECSSSALTSVITNGALFYITNSKAVITVQETDIEFDATTNYLIKAAGNDGEHGWGTEGANGAGVVFTAIDQTLKGDISVDGISSNEVYLVNSTYTGAFVADTTYEGDGGSDLCIDGDSTWIVTADCTLRNLTAASGAKIVDADGNTVRIVAGGEAVVDGASARTVTVSNYIPGSFVATNITEFTVDRSVFDAKYGTSESAEGDSSQGQSSGSKTYYFKPHAPTNGVVGVSYNGTKIYPDMDHKYWLDAYWTNGVTVSIDFSADAGSVFADGSSTTNLVLTITENRIDLYPPAGFETAYRAQAKSGATYYLTLQKAIEAGKREITLTDNVTLEETLVVTNSVVLNLNTNTVTLGSALTEPFHFSATAVISNGTITSSLAANAEGSVLMRFTDCKATLKDLTIDGGGYARVVAHDSISGSTEKYSNSKHTFDSMLCDRLVLTGNGCLLGVDYATATLTNGCMFSADGTRTSFGGALAAAVSCTGNGTVTIADGTYASPKVLQSGDLGGGIVVNGGTFSGEIYSWMSASAHTNLEQYAKYKARFTFNAGTYTDASIAFAYADSFDLSSFTKGNGVAIAVPTGYAWNDNALTRESITAGVTSEAYSDAQSATNAAAAINANKASSIVVPTGVEADSKEVYLAKIEATVTSENRIVVDLTTADQIEEQAIVDAAVTNETALVALTSTNASATVTLAKTTPGLYYWIEGGTDVNTVTNAGAGVLSTDGGSVELSKPALDATTGKAFFRLSAGVLMGR